MMLLWLLEMFHTYTFTHNDTGRQQWHVIELRLFWQSGLGVASAERAVADARWAEQDAFEDAQIAAYYSSSDEEEMR